MTNPLKLIRALDDSPPVSPRIQPIKSRRERRQEEHDRVKAARFNQKKIGRLSA